MGTPPPAPKREVKPRTSRVFEIELHPLFKTEEMPVEEEVAPQAAMVEESVVEDTWQEEGYVVDSAVEEVVEPQGAIEKYTVEKGDTLQKISQKFYGTTRKWQMLFEVNKDKLKAPDKIYPGQVIDIPVESAIKAKVK
ncbi:MAG: peptidoglycan-binding protein LysM [Candidatus Omnitrophota bacterium]|nr:MAG: peptidoglycan-binding protein LysM [Candidatus Omnitrophota bacterium]